MKKSMTIIELIKNKAALIIILIMAVYIGIALFSDTHKMLEYLKKIRLESILLILLLEGASLTCRSFRQQKLLDTIGIKISFLENWKIYVASMSMVATPGGSGTLIKSHFLKRNYGENISKTFPLVFVERYYDFLAVVAILIFTLGISYLWQSFIIIVVSISLLVGIYIIVRNQKLLTIVQNKIKNQRILSRFTPTIEFNESLQKLTRPKIMLKSSLISMPAFLLDAAAIYVGFLSFGQNFEFIHLTQMYYTSILYGVVSFLPGGVGVTEGSFIGLLIINGLKLSVASTLVLFTRLTTIWFATALGFVFTRLVLKQKMIKNQ